MFNFGMLTISESREIIRKPDGNSGASSAQDASTGANISSEQVPGEFLFNPLQNCQCQFVSSQKIQSC